MDNKASITALISAFGRAYHTENESNPVFSDVLAKRLLTPEEYASIGAYILNGMDFFAPEKKDSVKTDRDALLYLINTHIAPTSLCRSAYCEQSLDTAVKTGTEQYVILGAGLDTYAFRHPGTVKIFEADHPQTQADKISRLKRAGLEILENLTFVSVDFTGDSISEKLLESGFNPKKKTFFSWPGVSYYLCRDETEHFLKSLSEIMSEGSTLLFDYADQGLFLSKERRVRCMIDTAKAGGGEMKSSYDYMSIDSMLADCGMLIYEILTPHDIGEQIIKNRNMKAFEHINYIQAVFKP